MKQALHPRFPDVELPHLSEVQLSSMSNVVLRQPEVPALVNPLSELRLRLNQRADLFSLPKGSSIAIAVGSRGITRIDEITQFVVSWLIEQEFEPFIVPGMGSHGGGSAEGQISVLEKLGVTEAAMGCPIRSSMSTVSYGEIKGGLTCHFDSIAAAANGIVVINRVKAHTSFPRPVESGLTKMLAVGLGKAEGARQVHLFGPRGLRDILPRLANRIIERAPLIAGIAIVENAKKQLSQMEVAAPRDFYDVDKRLLVQAKTAMARLPFSQIDGLIVEEVGKEISGAGIAPAVTGRTDIRGVDNPAEPFIHKIVALDLTDNTAGNGIGVGMVDYIPRRMADQLDLQAMYMNAVTATILEKAFIPIVLPDDLACIRALEATCWASGLPRICQIRSSAELDRIAVSRPLLEELRETDFLLDEQPAEFPQFDSANRLSSRLGETS